MDTVVRESGLQAMFEKLRQADPESEQLDNVEELISAAAEFDEENPGASLTDYLARVSLVSDVDALKDGGGAITLMTLHAAKGLEFPVVTIIGLEDGLLPHARVYEDPPQMEEERRLCFVGITRAQERLLLTLAADRMMRGRRERTVPSPFLHEMPREALEVVDHTGMGSRDRSPPPPREIEPSDTQEETVLLAPGQLVRHGRFGLGRVVEVRDAGPDTRAVIDFNTSGRKTLVLKFAGLEPV